MPHIVKYFFLGFETFIKMVPPQFLKAYPEIAKTTENYQHLRMSKACIIKKMWSLYIANNNLNITFVVIIKNKMRIQLVILFVVVQLLFVEIGHAQPGLLPENASNILDLHKKGKKGHLDLELNLGICYFPIYDLGANGAYKLDGQKLMHSDIQYYCALPGQRVFAKYITDPTDQAWVATFTGTYWRENGFNRKKKLQFLLGLTHDKAQTNNTSGNQPLFRFNDGGGEITLLASYVWQFGDSIRNVTRDTKNHLIIELSFQAGPIFSINEDAFIIDYNGNHITNQIPATTKLSDRRFEGYGFVANVHSVFGYRVGKLSFTTGLNLGIEGQHHMVAAKVNDDYGHKLTVNTFGVFITPLFNVGYKFR